MRTTYFGNEGGNFFQATTNIRESFYGLGGNDVFHFHEAGTFRDFSDRFFGGTGDDRMQGLSVSFDGNSGLDAYDLLSFDGGRGYDTLAADVSIGMGAYAGTSSTLDFTEITTLSLSVEHHEFDVSLTGVSATVEDLLLKGGAKDETVRLTQSASMATGGELRVNLRGGDDYFEFSADSTVTSDLTVLTRRGNDTVIINAVNTSYPDGLTTKVLTGKGNDTVVLEGMYSETVRAGGGADQIYVLTGGFANAADTIYTGAGRDKVYLELDAYSTVARLMDFAADKDKIVFDKAEFRDTTVTFDKTTWQAASEDTLYMDNAAGKLYFGANVLADFGGATTLAADNFVTDTWAF